MRKWLLAVLSLTMVGAASSCSVLDGLFPKEDSSSASTVEQESSVTESSVTESSSSASASESGEESSSETHRHTPAKTEAKAATCTEEGNIAYWTCSGCEKLFSDEACTTEIELADTVVAKAAHTPEKTEAKDATCTEEGNIEYWTCSGCEKLFSDEACTTEIELADTVVAKAVHTPEKTEAKAATCAEEGNIEYWTCSGCEKLFSDEACTTEIELANTVVAATGVHTFDEDGNCKKCDAKATDKALYLQAEVNGTVTHSEKGWKISAADKTLSTYNFTLNKEITAWNLARGNKTLTITFGGAFDGTSYTSGNPVNCTKWIVPAYADPQMDSEGNISNENWNYNAGFISQLTDNGDGSYTATIDLTDTTYDFVNKPLKICVSVADAGDAAIGDCYVTDISYWGDPTAEEYFVRHTATTNVTYDEAANTYTINGTTDATYFKIPSRVIKYWIEQGNAKLVLTFTNDAARPLTEATWKQVQYHSDSTCIENGVRIKGADLNVPVTKTVILADYKDTGIYFFTDKSTACDLIVKITLSDGKLVEPEKSDWVTSTSTADSTVTYTEDKGWKVTAKDTSVSTYNFQITQETMAYYISEGYTTLKITFGGSFDGTNHAGAPVNCQRWILAKNAETLTDDWSYMAGWISKLTSNGDNNTYYATIDLTDSTYNFADYPLGICIGVNDVENNVVGACYIYNIEFSK